MCRKSGVVKGNEMKSARDYLESEVKRLTDNARAVTRKAEDEGRMLETAEREQVEDLIEQVTALKSRISDMDENDRLVNAIRDAGSVGQGEPTVAPKSARDPGTAFTQSDGYKRLMERGLKGGWSSGPVELPFGAKLTDGGLTVIDTTDATNGLFAPGGNSITPQILPGVQTPVEQALTIADLLGTGVATSNTIVFMYESSTSKDAEVTAEGDPKPASSLEFDKASKAVDKIATFLPVSDEMLEDAPQLASYINGRLALFVRQEEETYILGELNVETASSAAEVGGDNLFDAIAAAIMHVRVDSGLEPDALVVSPLDAAKMDTARATGGTGAYFSGGPYGAASNNPWGLKRVVTTAVSDGMGIVGAWRQGATVFRRGGLSVEASNSHADYFRKNLTAIRAEERLAVVQFRASAFQQLNAGS